MRTLYLLSAIFLFLFVLKSMNENKNNQYSKKEMQLIFSQINEKNKAIYKNFLKADLSGL